MVSPVMSLMRGVLTDTMSKTQHLPGSVPVRFYVQKTHFRSLMM